MIESNAYGYYEDKTHVRVFKGPCYTLYKNQLSLILVYMSVYMLYKREQYLFLSQHYVSAMHPCRYIQREGLKLPFFFNIPQNVCIIVYSFSIERNFYCFQFFVITSRYFLHTFPGINVHIYPSCELPDVQADFRKGRGTRGQIANIHWIIEKARDFQKNIYFCFIDYAKAFDCVDHNKLWKILKEMGIPDHLTCLLRNLYAGQEATVRTGHGPTDWFQIGKGVCQGCILSPCIFDLYEEQIMRNARLEETQAGIKIAGRNINNLRYEDDYSYGRK